MMDVEWIPGQAREAHTSELQCDVTAELILLSKCAWLYHHLLARCDLCISDACLHIGCKSLPGYYQMRLYIGL